MVDITRSGLRQGTSPFLIQRRIHWRVKILLQLSRWELFMNRVLNSMTKHTGICITNCKSLANQHRKSQPFHVISILNSIFKISCGGIRLKVFKRNSTISQKTICAQIQLLLSLKDKPLATRILLSLSRSMKISESSIRTDQMVPSKNKHSRL